MALQELNLGATAGDGTGDTLRAGGSKLNANFAFLDTEFRQDGQTIEESTEFSQGGTYTLDPDESRDRFVWVTGADDGALTANMTVNLNPSEMPVGRWGFVGKRDTSSFTVTVTGFFIDGLGTVNLRNQYDMVFWAAVNTDDGAGLGPNGCKIEEVHRFRQASQTEAATGTDNRNFMTPLRTAQAIAALGGGGGGGASLPVDDTTALIRDPADNTKLLRLDVGGAPTGQTQVISTTRTVDLSATGTFAEKVHVHSLSDVTDAGVLASADVAAGVPATPHGGIAGTDVQTQLEQLETNKVDSSDLGDLALTSSPLDVTLGGTGVTSVPAFRSVLSDGSNAAGELVQFEDAGGGAPRYPAGDGSQITGISGTGGGLTLTPVAGATLTINALSDGLEYEMLSDSAITITFDAQTDGDVDCEIFKAGAGVVTVEMESGATWCFDGDDHGDEFVATSFEVTGRIRVRWKDNSGGNAARYVITGQTNQPTLSFANHDMDDHDILNIGDGSTFQTPATTLAALGGLPLAGGTITGQTTLGSGGSISDAGPISASGSLTKATHGGRAVLTSGNVTIPNASGDVGMGGMIILGGAHTITFNSTVTATLASGDIFTYYVQSTTVLKRALLEAGDQPAMT